MRGFTTLLFCIGIGGGLLTSCGETIDVVSPDGTVTRDITVQVIPMQSIGNAVATRADLTAAEKEIKTAYAVQFNGTLPNSTVVRVSGELSNQLNNSGLIKCDFTLTSTRSRVYVIANLSTTPAIGMTLAAFETVAYTVSTSLPATGLPMAAYQDVTSSETFGVFQLKSPLAKLTFTANMGILSLHGIPSAYSLALTSMTPGDSPVRPSGITYTATAPLASGTTYYVPANLSGRVNLPDVIYRCSLVAPTGSMYMVVTANNTTYNTYLGDGTPSDFNVVSNCAYTIAANAHYSDGSDMRVGNPTSLALDAKGTANCYIAPCANMPCSFSATVMGNGKTTPAHAKSAEAGDLDFPAIVPSTLVPTSVEVLWETVNTTSAPTKGSVINGVSLSGGRVSFRSGTVPGNAVIAVKNGSGQILWSWHIWRLNETPKEIGLNAIGSLTTNGELVMMDRNLGALSAVAGSDLSIGMLYQWGRKDPMPGGASLTVSSTAMATQPSGIPRIASGSSSGSSIATAVANPTTFYTGGDWCTPRTDNLWGTPLTEKSTIYNGERENIINTNPGMKSIYDPCPVGWRVPPGYAFVNATSINSPWDSTYKGRDFAKITVSPSSTFFVPALGNRVNSNGTLDGVGNYGNYWTSTPYANNLAYGSNFYFYSSYVAPAVVDFRGIGYGCRCVRE